MQDRKLKLDRRRLLLTGAAAAGGTRDFDPAGVCDYAG